MDLRGRKWAERQPIHNRHWEINLRCYNPLWSHNCLLCS
jgi:hypothetical protein